MAFEQAFGEGITKAQLLPWKLSLKLDATKHIYNSVKIIDSRRIMLENLMNARSSSLRKFL